MTLLLHSTLRTATPVSKRTGVVWSTIADEVLGKNYDLSVVLIGDTRSHRLNRTYRSKDKPTNVLAFPVSATSGEIYLNVPYAMKEAVDYDHTEKNHLDYLFIHGLLHLKGFDHGAPMEKYEAALMKRLKKK